MSDMIKINEIREKSDLDLIAQLAELKKELFNLRFQKKTGSLTNSSRFSKVRKTVAKIKTVMSERRLSKTE